MSTAKTRPASRLRCARPAHLLAGVLALLPLREAAALAQPCVPGNRALHDFHAGDVFQYSETGTYRLSAYTTYTALRKYRIVSVGGTPEARAYVIHGLSWSESRPQGGEATVRTAPIDDTLIVLDSASHPLNGCPGDVVPMPNGAGYRTRITTAVGDSRLFPLALPGQGLKWVGGEVRDPRGPIVDQPHYDLVYAEGLGLVRASMSSLGSDTYSRALVGYVKDGDTVGAVYPDAEHRKGPTVALRGGTEKGASPRAAAFPGKRSAAFDLLGRPAQARLPALLRF